MIGTGAAISASKMFFIGYCGLSTSFHHHMVLVVHTHEEMLSLPSFSCQRAWTGPAVVGDYYGQRHTTWCSWKEGRHIPHGVHGKKALSFDFDITYPERTDRLCNWKSLTQEMYNV
jgi:hypothetical protein